MLKLNKNLNRGKTQLAGNFKLPFSLNGSTSNEPKWVNENETLMVESLIGQLFLKYLKDFKGENVIDFSHNEKDDHKNPDIYIHYEDKKLGAQITQFVIREYLSRYNQANRICEKLAGFISNTYKPSIKINIQICTPWNSDDIPKAPIKKYKKLAKLIAIQVKSNIEHLKNNNEILNFNLNHTEFKDIAESYNLYPVPDNHKSNYIGKNNIFIDYGFDYVVIYEEDIYKTAEKIFNDKNNGHSEILIIWGDKRQFINTEIHIIKILKERFFNTSFSMVYFLSFANYLNLEERIINVNRII